MPTCAHLHMKFSDGSYRLTCIDCGQDWTAVTAGGVGDYRLKSVPIYPPHDTRHDRWVTPRAEALPPLTVTVLKKPVK